MTRLTPAQRADLQLTEADFQRQVTELAEMLGWAWVHHRPAQTAHGWRTPVSGPLGKGWPDLVLLRVRDRRLIFAELKRETQQPDADQAAVLAALGEIDWRRILDGRTDGMGEAIKRAEHWAIGRLEVHLWRPSDFPRITEILR